jgi:thymidylate kinase
LDRFEKEAMDFHHRVRDTYGKIAKREPDRVKSIGVSDMSIERVYEAVLPVVKAKLESEGGDL